MINFDTPQKTAPSPVTVTTEVPAVQETVTITPVVKKATPAPKGTVTWEKLRDYVIEKVEATSGPFPRDIRKENTIFMAFSARWQELAEPIAQHAFEACEGIWKGAPVSVARFHRTSDSFFAQPIAEQLPR
jgi:hypothetical protein